MTLPAKKKKGRQDQPFAKVAKETPTKAGISCDKLTRFTSPAGLICLLLGAKIGEDLLLICKTRFL